ncbi:MAG: glycoside hydrolase family 95 protein, partial [Hamadaea sp.]|nr:glycoside hydrolase family 95 protein [Hamadaea sp.]
MPELIFTQPAAAWEEALPVGNGRLGAMVHGGFAAERISLNEDTFWSGPGDLSLPEVPPGLLGEVRDLVRQGRSVAAGELLRRTQGADAEAYQPIGDLEITFRDSSGGTCRRSLDLRDGVAHVHRDGTRQQVLASVAYQVIVIRLEADEPGGIDAELRWRPPHARAEARIVGADGLALLLAAPRHVIPWPRRDGAVLDDDDQRSMRAAALARVTTDGTVQATDGGLRIRHGRAAT